MKLYQMSVATLAGFLYGTALTFLTDFSIIVMKNITPPYIHLFDTCNIYMHMIFASYAYYFIAKQYGWLFLNGNGDDDSIHKYAMETVIYFGFLYSSCIVYPSELVCAIYNGYMDYTAHRIILSHATMIFIVNALEASKIHQYLLVTFYQ